MAQHGVERPDEPLGQFNAREIQIQHSHTTIECFLERMSEAPDGKAQDPTRVDIELARAGDFRIAIDFERIQRP